MADEGIGLMRAIVFVVSFSALFAFIFIYASPIFNSGSGPTDNDFINQNFNIEEIGSITFWDCDDYNLTGSTEWNTWVYATDITTTNPAHDGSRFDYTDGSNTVRVYPMGPDTDNDVSVANSFFIYQGWWSAYVIHNAEWETITFTAILQNLEYGDNNINAEFHIDLKGGFNVWFIFPTGSHPSALLDAGSGFAVVVGQSVLDATESTQNIWSALSNLITFNIDTGYDILNYLIGLPIWITIAYIAFALVKELIPFL
jgi:hypothetical protein